MVIEKVKGVSVDYAKGYAAALERFKKALYDEAEEIMYTDFKHNGTNYGNVVFTRNIERICEEISNDK